MREKKGYSRRKLSDITLISQPTIVRIEYRGAGDPNYNDCFPEDKTIMLLAPPFDLDMCELKEILKKDLRQERMIQTDTSEMEWDELIEHIRSEFT